MVSISSWRSDLVPGAICPRIGVVHPRLPSYIVSFKRSTFKSHDRICRKVPGISIAHLSVGERSVKCASFVEGNYRSSDNDDEDPFLITCMKQAIWDVKSLLLFLAEQPSQLKFIEWPGFQSTLKTATLALVLVGLFIVALSSVDSALSYMLILFLRRTT